MSAADEWIECPYYAVLEAEGGGWYVAQCDRLEGHDDSHHHPDVDPGFIDWTHPASELEVGS
jgi:hypothetical protein